MAQSVDRNDASINADRLSGTDSSEVGEEKHEPSENEPNNMDKQPRYQDHGMVSFQPLEIREKAKKKKRKSKTPKSRRGLDKPTGFEDSYADAPQTAENEAEDRELYNSNSSFVSRVQTAIQRFERTRKLSSERRDIFYKYLTYGGVDVSPNMFQGGQDLEAMDKDQIAATLAQASISDNKKNHDTKSGMYVVDFEGCMKGFLSRCAIHINGFQSFDNVKLITSTLERFMDYLLQHDVCPEYRAEVLKTRNLCREATSELWGCAEASRWLPGDFNVACSTLFGGSYASNYDGVTDWGPEDAGENIFVGMTFEVATQVLRFGVTGAASEKIYHDFLSTTKEDASGIEVSQVQEYAGFEITKIDPPSRQCLDLYATSMEKLRPVGRVYAKPWKNPDWAPEDLTAEERQAPTESESDIQHLTHEPKEEEEYIFLIEGAIQGNLRVGTKIEATIRKLNCGIWFFDDFLRIFPSFDTFLANELMVGWKAPGPMKGALADSDDEDDVDADDDEEDTKVDRGPVKEDSDNRENAAE